MRQYLCDVSVLISGGSQAEQGVKAGCQKDNVVQQDEEGLKTGVLAHQIAGSLR